MTPEQATQFMANFDSLMITVAEMNNYIQLGLGVLTGLFLSWITWFFIKGAVHR